MGANSIKGSILEMKRGKKTYRIEKTANCVDSERGSVTGKTVFRTSLYIEESS